MADERDTHPLFHKGQPDPANDRPLHLVQQDLLDAAALVAKMDGAHEEKKIRFATEALHLMSHARRALLAIENQHLRIPDTAEDQGGKR